MDNMKFKKCPDCGQEWQTREDFLFDKEIVIKGYQANFENLKLRLFLFDHLKCMTTMAIKAGEFRDVYDGPVFQKRMTSTSECPGYCLRSQELSRCQVECECAWVREVLNIIVHWQKRAF